MSSSFEYKFIVASSDIDEQGHVNNVAFVRWIQDVAVAHWNSVADAAVRDVFGWVVVRHEIDYRRQSFEGDVVTVRTWVGKRTRISWERFTEIRRDGEALVEARSVWCLVDRSTMKPSRITEKLASLLA